MWAGNRTHRSACRWVMSTLARGLRVGVRCPGRQGSSPSFVTELEDLVQVTRTCFSLSENQS